MSDSVLKRHPLPTKDGWCFVINMLEARFGLRSERSLLTDPYLICGPTNGHFGMDPTLVRVYQPQLSIHPPKDSLAGSIQINAGGKLLGLRGKRNQNQSLHWESLNVGCFCLCIPIADGELESMCSQDIDERLVGVTEDLPPEDLIGRFKLDHDGYRSFTRHVMIKLPTRIPYCFPRILPLQGDPCLITCTQGSASVSHKDSHGEVLGLDPTTILLASGIEDLYVELETPIVALEILSDSNEDDNYGLPLMTGSNALLKREMEKVYR